MAYQPIGLGTPNNNDGDSLYVGGVKINSNFSEIYTALGGFNTSTLKIAVGTSTLITSTVLAWNASEELFKPLEVDFLQNSTTGTVNRLYITDADGYAGFTDDIASSGDEVSQMQSVLDGNNQFTVRPGSIEFNLGNENVSSMGIYTTGVTVRGAHGLQVYAAQSEDLATYTQLLYSTTSGITLYQTPKLDLATVGAGILNGSDSSNALAHTGFVKSNLGRYTLSSTQIIARRGIIASITSASTLHGGTLADSLALNIDGIYHPKHVEGLIYNYNEIDNKITLVTGAAAHWSYSTSGVTGIIPTTAIAVVASYNPIIRQFATGWTPQYASNGATKAVIDGSISSDTWYYLYYIGCLIYTSSFGTGVGNEFWPGSSNVVVSSNRDIASVDAQLAAAGYGGVWQVVRRLGPVRSNATGTGLVPFNIKRIDHGGFEYYWGLQPNGPGATGGADTSFTLISYPASAGTGHATATNGIVSNSRGYLQIPPVKLSNATINLGATSSNYTSALLTLIPPIPGITAHLTIRHKPSGILPYIYMHGDSWTVNSSISALYPPYEVMRSTTSGITATHQIQLPMIPDGCYIPDGIYGGAGLLAVTTSTGQFLRYMMVSGEHPDANPASTVGSAELQGFGSSLALGVTVTGFRIAR